MTHVWPLLSARLIPPPLWETLVALLFHILLCLVMTKHPKAPFSNEGILVYGVKQGLARVWHCEGRAFHLNVSQDRDSSQHLLAREERFGRGRDCFCSSEQTGRVLNVSMLGNGLRGGERGGLEGWCCQGKVRACGRGVGFHYTNGTTTSVPFPTVPRCKIFYCTAIFLPSHWPTACATLLHPILLNTLCVRVMLRVSQNIEDIVAA